MIANTAFAYLPVIVAVSAARVFGGNIFLGAVIGLAMIHSTLTNGWSAADGYNVWYLFGHIKIGSYTLGQINVLGYQGHVIPVMIAVYMMSKIENRLHKVVPEMLDLFITPLTTVFVTLLLTFTIVGPVFSTAETMVLSGARTLITVGYGVGAFVMGALYPVTVVMGLHHMYNVIEAGLLASKEFGNLNIWMPIASAANFAQFGACLAVGIKAHQAKTKAVAIPSSISASLGITEPAIFGINMRFTKPFVCAMIGGAVGAMFGSWTGLGATAYGVTGIPGFLTINKPVIYAIMLLISGGVAFVLTMFAWKEEKKEETKVSAPSEIVLSSKEGSVTQPVNGQVVSASEIPDPVFSSESMGASVGILPSDGNVFAPFDGEVKMIFPTNHAIGLKSNEGIEVLIHIGVDTVDMNGDGFESFVKQGDSIKKGQKLIAFDQKKIKAAGHSDCVIVALTNTNDLTDVEKVK